MGGLRSSQSMAISQQQNQKLPSSTQSNSQTTKTNHRRRSKIRCFMNRTTSLLLLIVLALSGVNSLAVTGTKSKINSAQLTLPELEKIRGHRINPQTKINRMTRSVDSTDPKSRVTRDTLLDLYRKKSLYDKINRDLVRQFINQERYPQSSLQDQPKYITNFRNYKLDRIQFQPKSLQSPVNRRYKGSSVAAASSGSNDAETDYSRTRRDQLDHTKNLDGQDEGHVLSEEDRKTLQKLKDELARDQALRL